MIPARPRAVTITIDEAREVSGLLQVPPGAHVCCSARCCEPLRQQLPSAKRDRDFGFSRHNSERLPWVLPGGETGLATAPPSAVPWIPDITWGQGPIREPTGFERKRRQTSTVPPGLGAQRADRVVENPERLATSERRWSMSALLRLADVLTVRIDVS